MPSCRITNNTAHPLNICLKQVTALHFENSVQPGQAIKLKPGKVWFTLEALVDDGTKKSRYSILKSAATIALLSIAVGAVAATAGAALIPEAIALEGIAAASVAKGALVTNSGTIAKISSMALPRAIDKLSAELGGLSALQREVASIIASPTLSSDVRHRAATLLRSIHHAYKEDKAKSSGATEETTTGQSSLPEKLQSQKGKKKSKGETTNDPITPLSLEEAKKLDEQIESEEIDHLVENRPVNSGEVLLIHGIYMNKRREFEIRTGDNGKLILWDLKEKVVVT
ncbi:hypothetical protein I203_101092 [Kwoniella mangroviensis CBS 8507]|uniref:uncharacterized protein n=1 Tax=Kwoniella mangroviensis CBS 8507 TaxID=1296122 RepID=UPI00080D7F37|nr:uncharacterized protein I203_02727 [Kwoniella mangroviensis CBS 8507]OCF68068.1 hypothetical protein I203_02727 [Kwoniella mangroviensis CBS 8507]